MTDMTIGRLNADGSITPWTPAADTFDPFVLVAEFDRVFQTTNDVNVWADLIKEESEELLEAMGDHSQDTARLYWGNILKEASDLIYVMTGWALKVEASENPEEAVKSMDDVMWAVVNKALDTVFMLIGPEIMQEAFLLVHQSNLSKLGDDGKPLRRADGKVLKGPNYLPPDMGPLAARLYDNLQNDEAN